MIRAPETGAVPAAFLTVKFTDGMRTTTSVVSVALALVGTAGRGAAAGAVAGSAPVQSPAYTAYAPLNGKRFVAVIADCSVPSPNFRGPVVMLLLSSMTLRAFAATNSVFRMAPDASSLCVTNLIVRVPATSYWYVTDETLSDAIVAGDDGAADPALS